MYRDHAYQGLEEATYLYLSNRNSLSYIVHHKPVFLEATNLTDYLGF